MIPLNAVFRCVDCEDTNKAKLGLAGFEPLETEFTTLTAAVAHLKQHLEHEVLVEVGRDGSQ